MTLQLKPLPTLPAPVIRLLTSKDFKPKPGRLGVTALLAPIQQTVLKRRYYPQIKAAEKPTDAQARVLGTIAHEALEAAGLDLISEGHALKVERFVTEYFFDWALTGVIDLLEDGWLYDYKLTGAKSYGNTDKAEDWIKQLAIYRYLLWKQGIHTKGSRIVMWAKDYSQLAGLRERTYPPDAIVPLELPEIRMPMCEALIHKKMALLIANFWAEDNSLTPCSDEEMWAKPNTYAAQKRGLKRASRVLASEEEAVKWIAEQKQPKLYSIIFRPGRRNRCEGVMDGGPCYCDAAPYCHQHQAYLRNKQREVQKND